MAELAFFRGTSSSERLFLLVLRLRKLEVEEQCLLHLVHVAGTRMIGQGADGLSRGNLTEGVMKGRSMLSYVPLGELALSREPGLENWIKSWAGESLKVLDPEGCSRKDKEFKDIIVTRWDAILPRCSEGMFLWCPAPVAASVATEEL
jgi:hypothetical protein